MKKNYIIIIVVIIAGIIGYNKFSKSDTDTAEKNSYFTVARGDLNISVTESGVLKAVDEEVIKNQLDGKSIVTWIVPEGTEVKKGDLLVEIDPAAVTEILQKMQIQVDTSKSALTTAQNDLLIEKSTIESEQRDAAEQIEFAEMDLKKFTELDKKQQIREAKSTISSEIEKLKIEEDTFRWSEKLAAKGFETKSKVEQDKLKLVNSQKSLESSQTRLKMLEKYDLPKRQLELDAKLDEAKKKHERIITQGKSKVSRSEGKLETAERQLKVNEERLAIIEEQLKHTKLYAPINGVVIYPAQKGYYSSSNNDETISKNKKLISIPNLDKMKSIVKIPEFHISKIKMGQAAFVSIESISDNRYKGTVTKVSPLPDKTNFWSAGSKKLYEVEVTITDKLPNVKPSISTKSEIIITDLKDVLCIPLHCIFTEKDKHYCYTKDGDQHRKNEVQIGLINNSFAEITDGISEGDQILLNRPN